MQAGYRSRTALNVKGPGFLGADFASRWDDPERREVMMRAARLVEREPEMLGAASHLMAVAHKVVELRTSNHLRRAWQLRSSKPIAALPGGYWRDASSIPR